MKSIMLSIQPQLVEKILNREKTIEIRKTMPKCELPCKVYIYCTKGKNTIVYVERKGEFDWFGNTAKETTICTRPKYWYMGDKLSKVVAEFTLKRIDTIEICDPDILINGKQCKQANLQAECQVSINDIMSYIGYGNDHDGWGRDWDKGSLWHIDDLKIYGKPKELSDFRKLYNEREGGWQNLRVTRPPQSYMYVEELGEK